MWGHPARDIHIHGIKSQPLSFMVSNCICAFTCKLCYTALLYCFKLSILSGDKLVLCKNLSADFDTFTFSRPYYRASLFKINNRPYRSVLKVSFFRVMEMQYALYFR